MQGRVALVTGASRGIGEFVARRFAADGAAVAVSARTVEEGDHPLPGSISGTVQTIRDAGGTAIAIAADLGKQEDRTRLIETVDEAGPFGAKGLGESGVIPVAAAVANAVKDAVGVRITELPLRPERVHRALAARESAKE